MMDSNFQGKGGDLRKYYPLIEEAQIEYELWLKINQTNQVCVYKF